MEKEFSVVCPMADYMRGFRDAGRFKEYCKVCGQYGTCWACPPFDFDTDGYLARYENILLVAVKIDVPCRSEKMSELVKSDDSEILPANDGIADIAIERSMKLLEQTRVVMDRELLEKEAQLHGRAFFAGTCLLCGCGAAAAGGVATGGAVDASGGMFAGRGAGQGAKRGAKQGAKQGAESGGGCTRREGLPCRYPDKVRPSLESMGFDIGKTAKELFGLELKWASYGMLPEYYVLVGAVMY